MSINKIFDSAEAAVADIPDGATIMTGGFGTPGDVPFHLIEALRKQGSRELVIISNSPGREATDALKKWGISLWTSPNVLIENKQVKKYICSIAFPGSPAERAYLAGELEIEFVPQGTLAERIRAGAFGIGGFYTPSGVGTIIEEQKEVRIINGKKYLFETPLRADYALIKAYKSDKLGNLVYRGAMRSFNVIMAPAADITIVEVEEIVEVGGLDPEAVVTSEIFVDRIVRCPGEGL